MLSVVSRETFAMSPNTRLWTFNPPDCGGLAQLARAPALQAGGQRFESVILHDSVCDWGRGMGNHHFSFLIPHFSFRKEIFDILTHKTVSKDFKLKTELYLL